MSWENTPRLFSVTLSASYHSNTPPPPPPPCSEVGHITGKQPQHSCNSNALVSPNHHHLLTSPRNHQCLPTQSPAGGETRPSVLGSVCSCTTLTPAVTQETADSWCFSVLHRSTSWILQSVRNWALPQYVLFVFFALDNSVRAHDNSFWTIPRKRRHPETADTFFYYTVKPEHFVIRVRQVQ